MKFQRIFQIFSQGVSTIFSGKKNNFFQVMERSMQRSCLRALVPFVGLSGYKRLLRLSKLQDVKKLKSSLDRLLWKVENLEDAREKTSKDLEYIEQLKAVAFWLRDYINYLSGNRCYLYHLGGGLCAAKVSP